MGGGPLGEPVAIVAAEHPELARRAADRIVVDYEPLEPWWDMARRSARARRRCIRSGTPSDVRVTVIPTPRPTSGSRATTRPACRTRRPSDRRPGWRCWPRRGDPPCSLRGSYIDLRQPALCLNLVRRSRAPFLAGTGGAFGADVSMQIHACMLALYTGRPVKMSYGRDQPFLGHVHRHPRAFDADRREPRRHTDQRSAPGC